MGKWDEIGAMRADAGQDRGDDSHGGVEDAKFIADINVNRAGRESGGGNAVNGICASVSDLKKAGGGIPKIVSSGLLVIARPFVPNKERNVSVWLVAPGLEITAIFWSASPVRARTPVVVSFNESESVTVTDVCEPVARFVPVNVEFTIGQICSGECKPVVSFTITASAPLAGFVSLMKTLP